MIAKTKTRTNNKCTHTQISRYDQINDMYDCIDMYENNEKKKHSPEGFTLKKERERET